MELTGMKNHAIVTLDVVNYRLFVDVGNRVITIQYSGPTPLSSIIKDVESTLKVYGYTPKEIKQVRLKRFQF